MYMHMYIYTHTHTHTHTNSSLSRATAEKIGRTQDRTGSLSAYQLAKNACFLTLLPCFLAVRANDSVGVSLSATKALLYTQAQWS